MKTIYALYWSDGETATTTWLDTLPEGESVHDELTKEGCDATLFSFEVADDATEDDINVVLGDFLDGHVHLMDLNAVVLQ